MALLRPYTPGKELTCLCGRKFKTERGIKQHINWATSSRYTGPVLAKHGRCYTDAARYLNKKLLDRTQLASRLLTYVNAKPVEETTYTWVPYKLTKRGAD